MTGDSEVPAEIRELEADYHFLGELGRGGMAVVYLARDRALGRAVAIKVIRAKYVEDQEVMARFAREARTVAQLQHPNIVTIYAVRQLRSHGLALVMQYVPGRTLKEAIRADGQLPAARVEQVLRDVGAALTYAHRHGVVHRDVKPENIFLDEATGRALLSDFGAALSVAESDSHLTMVGTTIGTPAYMSPEQIDGSEIDDRSDMFSLALVGWEMLTARRPWSGVGLYSVIYRQKHEELPPADAYRPDIPPALLYAIEGALRKSRDERWANVEEFIGKLSAGGGEIRRWKRRRRAARSTVTVAPPGADGLPPEVAEAPTVTFHSAAGARIPERDAPPALDAAGGSIPASAPRRTRLAAAAALVLVAAGGAAVWSRYRPEGVRAEPVARTGVVSDAPRSTPVPVTGVNVPTPLDSSLASDLAAAAPDSAAARDSAATREVAPPEDTAPEDAVPARAAAPPTSRRDSAAPASDASGRGTTPRAVVRETVFVARPQQSPPPPRGSAAQGDSDAPALPAAPPPAPPAAARNPAAAAVASALAAPARGGTAVLAGGMHSCVLRGGEAYCWGSNERGQLGTGGRDRQATPVPVAGGVRFAAISLGNSHSCALTPQGALFCWGANDRGQVGDNGTEDRTAPTPVAGGRRYRVVSASLAHSCALGEGGEAYCWGANDAGQLGDNSRIDRRAPTRVAGGLRFTTVTTGWKHSCALDREGRAYCWGENANGQLGVGGTADRSAPTPVSGDLRFARIGAGMAHTCALTTVGEAYCWGRNNFGQLGTGTAGGNEPTPVRVAGGDLYVALAVGSVHNCALLYGGAARCWGRNSYGQLGDGTTTDRPLPTAVYGGVSFQRLTANGAHSCGVAAGGTFCWGYNVAGQLGDGSADNRARPTAVTRPTS